MIKYLKRLRIEKKIIILNLIIAIPLITLFTEQIASYIFLGIAIGYTLFIIDDEILQSRHSMI